MAISFSRPDPSSPAAVADAAFGTARRGFDQQEVRDFLRMVAAELARLQERERFLERELLAAQANRLPAEGMDDDTATRLLGEEAARILQTAREGAASIRIRAEDGAAQLLREAADDAQRVREEADLEASRRRTDAAADAESELAAAKQQGREMVDEARAYRERVLGELSRRRELAREQIEQLLHGRQRLLDAFERAREAAVEVVADITPIGEPDEDIDLTAITGPVPITVPAADLADASAIDDIALVVESGFVVEEAEPPEVDEPTAPAEATVLAFPVPPETETEVQTETHVDAEPEIETETETPPPADEIDDDDVTATDIDDLFARLRSDPPEMSDEERDGLDADADGDLDSEPAVETPFRRRDAALVPLIVAAARKLKRVLADEQNEVLDALRGREPITDVDRLVAGGDEQSARYVDAVTAELIAATMAGAASVEPDAAADLDPAGAVEAARAQLIGELVAPLRERLERSVGDGDGDNDAVAKRARSVYREWKTQRIDEHLDDIFRVAFCDGAVAAGVDRRVTWEVDPDGPSSPDCEDNALAGPVRVGDAFPSGHTSPPMHPGCRCLLVPVDE